MYLQILSLSFIVTILCKFRESLIITVWSIFIFSLYSFIMTASVV
jgi:hypothetical protein